MQGYVLAKAFTSENPFHRILFQFYYEAAPPSTQVGLSESLARFLSKFPLHNHRKYASSARYMVLCAASSRHEAVRFHFQAELRKLFLHAGLTPMPNFLGFSGNLPENLNRLSDFFEEFPDPASKHFSEIQGLFSYLEAATLKFQCGVHAGVKRAGTGEAMIAPSF